MNTVYTIIDKRTNKVMSNTGRRVGHNVQTPIDLIGLENAENVLKSLKKDFERDNVELILIPMGEYRKLEPIEEPEATYSLNWDNNK